MSEQNFLKSKSKDEFYLNDKRFFVFYNKGSENNDISLLNKDHFSIEENEIGYEITIEKYGGYVGLDIPIFSELIVGNQFFNTGKFQRNTYCYNKKNFNEFYKISEEEYTEIYYPIFHNLISDNKVLSVSPASDHEVIINTHKRFKHFVRIQTYAHYQNDYVKFFIDKSCSYHLNLNRVSSSTKNIKLDRRSSIVEYQDVLFNNLNVSGLNQDENENKKKDVKKVSKFIKNKLGGPLVLQDTGSLWLNDYIDIPPSNFEALFGLKHHNNFHEFLSCLLNGIRDSEIFNEDDILNVNPKDKFIKLSLDNTNIKIFFCKKWSEDEKRVNKFENYLYALDPEAELERNVLEYQSYDIKNKSRKKYNKLEQRISKLIWKLKIKEGFTDNSIFSLIGSFHNDYLDNYFKNYYEKFKYKKFEKIKDNILDNVEMSYMNVNVNRPFFVSVYEDDYFYYFVIVNSRYKTEKCKIVVDNKFENLTWVGLKNENNTVSNYEEYMKHMEIFLDDVVFGGVLLASKK